MRNDTEALELIFATGGTTGALMRTIDWSSTPLGPARSWPQSLKSTLSICLSSRFPIAIYWGPRHILLYNDPWIAVLGNRHPWALGRPASEIWPDWQQLFGPRFERVLSGESVCATAEPLATNRHGYTEECYFDYALAPVRGENGEIAGIFTPTLDTTSRVVSERRARLLHSLARATAGARSAEQVCTLATDMLASGSADVAFCLTYLISQDNHLAYLAASAGFPVNSPATPPTLELPLDSRQPQEPWPLSQVFRRQQPLLVEHLGQRLTVPIPGGAWPEPATAAAITPINDVTRRSTLGFLVLGLSPRRPFDEAYEAFVKSAAESIGAAISNARTRDQERINLRARLAKLASVAPAAIFEFRLSPDGAMSMPYSTPAIADIYGHTPEEIAQDFSLASNRNHPDDQERIRSITAESARTLAPIHAEWRVLHPRKGEVWIETRSTPEPQPDGTVIWYGYFHDITERKRMEEDLREREVKFRQLAENIQEVFWLMDPRTRELLYVSPAYEEIWGRSRSQLRVAPDDWLDAIHADDRQRVLELMARSAGAPYDFEYRVVRPDGSLRVIHDRAFPIRDEKGFVHRIAGLAEDVTAQKRREKQIKFLAYHDALTRLPNRALLANRLRQAIAHAERSGETLAVMFLDIDRFKAINDTLGHPAGDSLLQQIGHRLTQTLRAGDTVARSGGDEFLLLVPGLHSPEEAAPVAEHVLACLAAPFAIAGQKLQVTGSVGISVCPRDSSEAQSLIKYADAALYLAKEQGRNTFRFFSPQLDAKVRSRMQLESELRAAIDRQQFLLHYQPQIELATGKVTGVEALLRWMHPEKGLVQPAAFMAVAEETGLIIPIGEWALRQACTQARSWAQKGWPGVRVSVNISGRQLNGANLVGSIQRILRDTGCDPHLLGIELTESSAMDDPEEAITILQELHELGVEIAIDDFGTGYSSMAYLKRFALDRLKIDAEFIQGVPGDENDIAIVQAAIALAHRFRLKVTAEGVETEAQELFLKSYGCDAVQGYLVGPPRAEPDLRELL